MSFTAAHLCLPSHTCFTAAHTFFSSKIFLLLTIFSINCKQCIAMCCPSTLRSVSLVIPASVQHTPFCILHHKELFCCVTRTLTIFSINCKNNVMSFQCPSRVLSFLIKIPSVVLTVYLADIHCKTVLHLIGVVGTAV